MRAPGASYGGEARQGRVADGVPEEVPRALVVPPQAVLQQEADAAAARQALPQEPDRRVSRDG